MNTQVRNKDLKVQKVWGVVLKGALAIFKVTKNLINLKNNKGIPGIEVRGRLSNVIKVCTESLAFLGMANKAGATLENNAYPKSYHESCSLLLSMSLHHQNFCKVII